MEEEKRRNPHGIVATNKKSAQKVLKGQETRTRMCNVSDEMCDVSEEEEEELEVVIEKGKQCFIEHTRSRSRQKQVKEKGGKKKSSTGQETRA
eukprot:6563986-Ditylum_brightwellii.AAC.1